jgi:ABC-type multidrug transport system ATPase subunit
MNAIETLQLTRTFGERVTVNKLTLSIQEGKVFGSMGSNGVGKTTTWQLFEREVILTH